MNKIPYYSDILETNFTQGSPDVIIHSVPEWHKVEYGSCCQGEIKINKSIISSTSPFLKQCLLKTTDVTNIFVNTKPESLEMLADFMTKGILTFDHTAPKNLGLLVDFLAFGINLNDLNLISTSYRDYNNIFENIHTNEENLFDFAHQDTSDHIEDSELKGGSDSKNEAGVTNMYSKVCENSNDYEAGKNFENDRNILGKTSYTDSNVKVDKTFSKKERLVQKRSKKSSTKKRMIEHFEQNKSEKEIFLAPPPKDNKFGLLFDELVAPNEDNVDLPEDLDLEQYEPQEEKLNEDLENESLMDLLDGLDETEKVKDIVKLTDSKKIKLEENSNGAFKSTVIDLKRYKMEDFDTSSNHRRYSHTKYLKTLGLDVDTFLPEAGSLTVPKRQAKYFWDTFEVKEGTRRDLKYNCKECLYSTEFRDNYLQHKLRHKHIELMKEKGFTHFCTASHKCDGIGFFSLAGLKKHLWGEHVEKKEKCEVCRKMVASRYFMAHEEFFHLQTESGPQPLMKKEHKVCINCGYNEKGTQDKHQIFTHLRARGKFHDDRCEQCEESFKSWAEKKTHMSEAHNNVWRYRCGKCGDVFENKEVLSHHGRKEHIEKMKTELCEICNKNIVPSNMQRHKKVHEDTKMYPCEVCGIGIVGRYFLDVHKRDKHSTQKECEVCGDVISGKYFTRHMLTHRKMEDRPWGCDMCPKRFNLKIGLDEHKNIHTGEKPFICDICGAKFANKSNMYQHKRGTHLGKKRVFKKVIKDEN